MIATNPFPRSRPRALARGLSLFSLSALCLASLGCHAGLDVRPKAPSFEAKAQFGGAASAEAYAVSDTPAMSEAPDASAGPAPSNYPQSGGGSFDSAELTTAGSTIAGRVAKGAPRFYAVDLAIGDSISLKTYGRQLVDGYTSLDVSVVEPDMVDLKDSRIYLSDGPEKLERRSFSVVASQAGRHFLKVRSNNQPTEYRIEITSLNRAAM